MKINKTHIIVAIFAPVLLFGFQNCSKLGTNGIAVDDQKLTLEGIEVADPVVGAEEPAVETETPVKETPNNGSNSGGNNGGNGGSSPTEGTEVVSQPNDPSASEDIEDPEIAEAVKACQASEPLAEQVNDLDLKFNHESVKVDVHRVTALQGTFGSYVLIRASGNAAVAESIHINNTTLILCNFAQIQNLKGSQNRIIVVGGEIAESLLNNSTLALVNADAPNTKGANTIIKHYSLK
ncbi:hypothetical protein [uncultured Bdellovibrio sp.]|uniref:hypothetical protein n=1 Tax=Bdellovibrio sp. HCB-162 TaxID=3394234 RepID=UPI0025D29646|nr:hypothetical protein [uncultured Bdellovibrio sp.]